MSSPFLVKGPKIITLPTHGTVGNIFNKVPKSPTGRPKDRHLPGILTRKPVRRCQRCRMNPCRCGGRK